MPFLWPVVFLFFRFFLLLQKIEDTFYLWYEILKLVVQTKKTAINFSRKSKWIRIRFEAETVSEWRKLINSFDMVEFNQLPSNHPFKRFRFDDIYSTPTNRYYKLITRQYPCTTAIDILWWHRKDHTVGFDVI